MKIILNTIFILSILFLISTTSCTKESSSSCGTYNGHELHKGPQGGCYYINSNGNKSYVDRSECSC